MHILCTICSDLVNQAENIHITKCGHIFHYHCLSQWIERSKSCPQCRNKVTEKCTFRVYPTISNEPTGDEAATLQSRLDNAQLQLRQQAAACAESDDKLRTALVDVKRYEEAAKAYEKKLISRDSAVSALKEQLEYVKIQNKETQKLKDSNEELKKSMQMLTGLQKVLNATSDEVEEMLQGYTDVRTVATFATALKRALCESEAKKKETRNFVVAVKQHLANEKMNCADWQTKYMQVQEKLAALEKKYAAISTKRKACEIMNDSVSILDDTLTNNVKVRKSDPDIFGDSMVIQDDTSFNTMVDRIEAADSPYFCLKQSSLALASLQRPQGHLDKLKPSEFALLNSARPDQRLGSENVPTNNHKSIFHKREPTKLVFSEERKDENIFNISYDGLGGHSKLETFPKPKVLSIKPRGSIPKLTARHKLSGNQNISNMFTNLSNKNK